MGQLAQLGECFGDFVQGVVKECDEVVVALRRGVCSCPSKVVGEAEQALELSRKKDPLSADLVRMMLVP